MADTREMKLQVDLEFSGLKTMIKEWNGELK